MAKLILKAPYYVPGSTADSGAGRGGYTKYIATREGVEIPKLGGMISYIGERSGSCGLFSDEGTPIVLSKISEDVEHHTGNVWGLIFSLKREDAERLGYNTAEQWVNLLRSRRNDIAKEMHISPENLRWYAAYHNKEKNPHVHMLVWSSRPQEPHLDRVGIHNIKHTIAGDIFRQELISLYKEQTAHRDNIREDFRRRMQEIEKQIQNSSVENPLLEEKILALSEKLKTVKGKKVYGYLDRKTKSQIDEIVKLICSDPHIAELYELWYRCRCESYRTYTDVMPEKIPLESNPEFKSLRNAAIKTAANLYNLAEPSDLTTDYIYEPSEYSRDVVAQAKALLAYGKKSEAWDLLIKNSGSYAWAFLGDCLIRGEHWKRNREYGLQLLTRAAEKNNSYAMLRLGQEYLYSGDTDDLEDAEYWLKEASEHGNYYAAYTLYNTSRKGKIKLNSADRKRYLLLAVDNKLPAAEYRYSVELQNINPELSLEYLQKSAEHGLPQGMYSLGKRLLDEGKTDEALCRLEQAAQKNNFAKTQLGLLYYYRFRDYDKTAEHLNAASANGYAPAQKAIQAIRSNRNAQIITGIANLFADLCGLFEENTEEDKPKLDVIDSRQKREEREKREAMGMRM